MEFLLCFTIAAGMTAGLLGWALVLRTSVGGRV